MVDIRALDAFSKAVTAAPESWINMPTALGNKAATLMMLER
jgi:hypothetical protein